LKDEVVAARAADLCKVAEEAFSQSKNNSHAPVYVIGTEVPIPGGAQEAEETVSVTKVKDAEHTIQITKAAFEAKGLQAAWERVIAVVVQPGVEFGDDTVFGYKHEKAKELSAFIQKYDKLVFEAHSTDYQTKEELRDLVKDHFAILKVGPWLTFAFREAVFALEGMEKAWLTGQKGITLSELQDTAEKVMLANPGNWNKHYHGDERYLAYARKYSYSDRVRYYWGQPELDAAVMKLIANLTAHPVPLSLLSQFMPLQYQAIRAGEICNTPTDLIHHKIMEVAAAYTQACDTTERK
jgi:D-tagatose-1,6-bisphosphate aldolase subunit GatZ/KbaZ